MSCCHPTDPVAGSIQDSCALSARASCSNNTRNHSVALESVELELMYAVLVCYTAVVVDGVAGIDTVADSMSAAAVVEVQTAFANVADVLESAAVVVCFLH